MFGDVLKQLRQESNLKQNELAEKLKISSSAVGMYEQNRRKPDIDSIIEIARFFGVTTDYLLEYKVSTTEEVDLNELTTNEKKQLKKIICLINQSKDSWKIINLFLQLDERDQAKIEGKIEDMLEADKYSKKGQEYA